MNCRFFKYLLLLFTVIAVKANGEAKNGRESVVYKRIFGPAAYSDRENDSYPNIFFLASRSPVQLYRSQVQRSVVFFKTIFGTANKLGTYFQFLSNIYQHTSAGYVRLCKLILFPFHVFW